ncbi:MAG TPA: DegT/DnrJ/EryC1/StrS family aminotransferase [Bryobacteraceae bacterium]|nr:DegT/DnrJ/EryC1/StrS family aminotransferase [Bryobacteraceae bacterium]
MALPWNRARTLPFPLDRTSLRSYYLARNGIYALARAWNLRNSEVLFPAYCHGVEVETLLAAGVKLQFYPVGLDMRVDVENIVSRLSPQTKAVYLIHYLGFPGPVEELSQVCQERGLLLIEDCALALLSRLGNKPLGCFGDAAVFCFYKTLPAPHGGALLMRSPESAPSPASDSPPLISTLAYSATAVWRHLNFNRGRLHGLLQNLRNSARSMSDALGVVPVGQRHFDPAQVHLSMSWLSQWITTGQDFQEIVENRRRNYLHLLNRLRNLAPPVFSELPPGVCPLFYPLRTCDKPTILQGLFQGGVEAVNFWSIIPDAIPPGAFPAADELRRTIVELPCHQDLTPDTMDRIADLVCGLRRAL